ncbi:MAG: hypothetical protein IT236_00575 [Bacteroidia bacterium]|nr:hypothetical protein [Bacteroidia bacterium]
MRYLIIVLLALCCANIKAQSISAILAENSKRPIQVGDSAPDIIATVGDNSIRSFALRKLKRITLLHFWNSFEPNTKIDQGHLYRLWEHYKNASFINANGFDVIAIAVQSDLKLWQSAIQNDSMAVFSHALAIRGFDDLVCKNYNVSATPYDILVDEKGIVIAINPKMVEIENILDSRKNYQPIKKDVSGTLAYASNKNEVLPFSKIYLFNYYGDSLATSMTNSKGNFVIHDLKLNQDFILKVDNKSNIVTTDPLALYSLDGEFLMNSKSEAGGFVFNVATRVANNLILKDSLNITKHLVEQIDVIKSLTFTPDGTKLSPKDEKELNIIVFDMLKSPELYLEYLVHTDSKVDGAKAMEITSNQVMAIKNYFQKRGLDLCHITGIAKGNTEMRKLCVGNADCTEDEHKLNRRVEFIIYKEELTD